MTLRHLLLAAICVLGTTMYAQEEGKPVVYIDYFKRPADVDATLVEALRNKVIQGIQETNRVQLVDVASQSQLSSEEERRKAETAMGDNTARTAEMRTLGANYIITGDVAAIGSTKRTDDKGKVSYKGSVRWSIKIIDAATGTLKTTQSFDHSGITGSSGSTPQEAIVATCDYAKHDMDDLIDDTFPIEGLVLKLETSNKGKAATVIIDLGTLKGIVKGQKFTVYLEADIAGEIAKTEIGALTAQEILSPKRTICKVSKGGEAVLKALNNEQKLIVISRKARTVLDGINGLF